MHAGGGRGGGGVSSLRGLSPSSWPSAQPARLPEVADRQQWQVITRKVHESDGRVTAGCAPGAASWSGGAARPAPWGFYDHTSIRSQRAVQLHHLCTSSTRPVRVERDCSPMHARTLLLCTFQRITHEITASPPVCRRCYWQQVRRALSSAHTVAQTVTARSDGWLPTKSRLSPPQLCCVPYRQQAWPGDRAAGSAPQRSQ